MRTAYLLVALLLGWGMKMEAEPLEMCALCVGHHGTCGCDLGHVVCCDGSDAYGCMCR